MNKDSETFVKAKRADIHLEHPSYGYGSMESPWTASPENASVAAFDQSGERFPVMTYSQRVESFKTKGWSSKLCKSDSANPENMATVGWLCTGPDSAKCYVCFKDLEGWEPMDDPELEHRKHCPACPLTVLAPKEKIPRTLREVLRMDIAIEFHRMKLTTLRELDDTMKAYEEQRIFLADLISDIRKRLVASVDLDESML